MARIEGPDGKVVNVDDDNRLRVFAVVQNEDKHANTEGRYWSVFVQVTPTGANDYFFYLKNNGIKDLLITDTRMSCTAPERFIYRRVTDTPSAGTDAEVTSRKLGDPKTPNAVIQYSVDFTGLTDSGVLFYEECDVANRRENLKTTSNIIVPQGQAIAFQAVTGGSAVTALISVSESEFA